MRVVILAALALLGGCGTTGLTGDPEETSYIMVSQGEAGGVASLFTGKARFCKATAHRLGSVAFAGEVIVDDKTCSVTISAEDK